jgi:hypothetical protein
LVIFVVLIIPVFLLLRKNLKEVDFNSNIKFSRVILLGLIAFVIGALPYLLVKKIPSYEGYDTRHQILLFLGLGLIYTSLLLKFINPKYLIAVSSVVTTMFITTSFGMNIQYIKNWLKQESMMAQLVDVKEFEQFNTFIFEDLTNDYDANTRGFAFYQLNGMVKFKLHREDFLISEYDEFFQDYKKERWQKGSSDFKTRNMGDYVFSKPAHLIKVDYGNEKLNLINTIRLSFLWIYNKSSFENEVINVVELTVHDFDFEASTVNLVNHSTNLKSSR